MNKSILTCIHPGWSWAYLDNVDSDFTKKEYDKALRMLLRVEFNDVYYHLDSKSLLMKVYYEMNEFDAFLSLVDAFRIYLRRNKFISEFQKETYSNFIQVINKLMKLKMRNQPITLSIHQDICETKPAADLHWLITKSEELARLAKIIWDNYKGKYLLYLILKPKQLIIEIN